MERCYYCGLAIKPGQRRVLSIATGNFFHRPCAEMRDERMAKAQADSRFGEVMIDYARLAERDGTAKEVVDEMFDHAMTIAEWQRHNPELVKPVSEIEEPEEPSAEPG